MPKVFIAMYDDSARKVPCRMFHKTPNTIYRTANMGFVEELSAAGFEPTAVLLEEDIETIKDGTYSDDALSAEDVTFLKDHLSHWVLKD